MKVAPVSSVFGSLLAGPSPVEAAERGAIAACWEQALAVRPKMFDGRVLLGESADLRDGALHVAFREVGFSTLVWLRTLPPDDLRLLNVFGAAAVVSSDGAALLGRMAPHTANAGEVYFPCGTPDLDDVSGDRVDIEGSLIRELYEETGLAAPLVRATEKAFVVFDGRIVAFIRVIETALDSGALAAAARAHLADEAEPELDDVALARSADDLPASAPRFVRAALPHLLGQ